MYQLGNFLAYVWLLLLHNRPSISGFDIHVQRRPLVTKENHKNY